MDDFMKPVGERTSTNIEKASEVDIEKLETTLINSIKRALKYGITEFEMKEEVEISSRDVAHHKIDIHIEYL